MQDSKIEQRTMIVDWNWVFIQHLSMMAMIVPQCTIINLSAPTWIEEEKKENLGNEINNEDTHKKYTQENNNIIMKIKHEDIKNKRNETIETRVG